MVLKNYKPLKTFGYWQRIKKTSAYLAVDLGWNFPPILDKNLQFWRLKSLKRVTYLSLIFKVHTDKKNSDIRD